MGVVHGGHPFSQDNELISAQAARGVVRTQAARDPAGNGYEELVAGRVAQDIVDRLEPVEIDQHDGEASWVAVTHLESVFEAVVEQSTVGEAGEAVVKRLVSYQCFTLLLVLHDIPQAQQYENERGDRTERDGKSVEALAEAGLAGQEDRARERGHTERSQASGCARTPFAGNGYCQLTHRWMQAGGTHAEVVQKPAALDQRSGAVGDTVQVEPPVEGVGAGEKDEPSGEEVERRP